MVCRDRTIDYLKALGYNVVRLPKVDLRPLQLIARSGRDFDRFGELTTVLVGDGRVPVPPVSADNAAPNISGQRTSNLRVGLGLSLLGDILAAMGGSKLGLELALEATYKRARAIAFEFRDVTEDHTTVAELDQYLTTADVSPFSTHAARLLDLDELFVVTATIRSRRIGVVALDQSGAAVTLDVPVVQAAVGADVSVEASSSANGMLVYEGATPLAFGFQAVQLFFDDGLYRALKPLDRGTLRSLQDAPDDGADRLVARAAMVRISDV